jgi:hypothetical protein
MAIDYRYVKQQDASFVVTETQTQTILKEHLQYEEAKKLTRHLNLGGGFAGWTPTFFNIPVMPIVDSLR